MERARARLFVRAAAGLVAVAAAYLVPTSARAAIIYDLSPSTSVGATSNAQALSNGSASAFSSLATVARLRGDTPRTRHSLSYRLAYTHYFDPGVNDTFGNELSGTSAFDLTGALSLSFAAGALVNRTSNVGTANLAGQAALPGSRLYVASSAREDLGYQATSRLRLSEGFSVNRVDYLTTSLQESPTGRPSTSLTGTLHCEYGWTRDSLSLDLRGTELITTDGVDPLGMPVSGGHTRLGQGLLGWRREISLPWSFQLQGGFAWMVQPSGESTPLPAGVASLDYRRLPWFATLAVSHAAVPNLFLGVATVNDQASLGLTIPLDRGDLVVLAGFASYSRARPANQNDPVAAAYGYDQMSVGSILSVRFRERPLFGSVSYSLINQHGTGGQALDVIRHTVLINLTAMFMFGPGTPPLYGGGGVVQ